jgi:hypothetical protein
MHVERIWKQIDASDVIGDRGWQGRSRGQRCCYLWEAPRALSAEARVPCRPVLAATMPARCCCCCSCCCRHNVRDALCPHRLDLLTFAFAQCRRCCRRRRRVVAVLTHRGAGISSKTSASISNQPPTIRLYFRRSPNLGPGASRSRIADGSSSPWAWRPCCLPATSCWTACGAETARTTAQNRHGSKITRDTSFEYV